MPYTNQQIRDIFKVDEDVEIIDLTEIITQLLDREDEIKRKIEEMKEEAKNAGEDEMNFAYECVLDLFN